MSIHARGMADSYRRGDERKREIIADNARLDFLRELEKALLTMAVTVDFWEAQFMADFLNSPRGFDPGQRKCVDQLREKYAHKKISSVARCRRARQRHGHKRPEKSGFQHKALPRSPQGCALAG